MGTPDRTDEILSAITMLSERIERLEGKTDRMTVKLDKVELVCCEMAKKLLAPAECRALGIIPPPVGGRSDQPASLPMAAKPRD